MERNADQPVRDPQKLIVVGASAGGVEALQAMARGLPADLPAAVVVVIHVPATTDSRLPQILERAGPLSARPAGDGAPISGGTIYVAPPDRHTIVSGGRVWLIEGARENRVRPAVDPLFRSAAREYGSRTIGVILSGTGDDGTAGLAEIAEAGGTTIVQDPDDALAEGMPRAALARVRIDHVVPAAQLGPLLDGIARPSAGTPVRAERLDVARRDLDARLNDWQGAELRGLPTDLSCPSCAGVLRNVSLGDVERYRCRVGHSFTVDALLDEQRDRLEDALWTAVRALEEQALTAGRLALRSRERGIAGASRTFEERHRRAAQQADIVRSAIQSVAVEPPLSEAAEEVEAAGDVEAVAPVGRSDSGVSTAG